MLIGNLFSKPIHRSINGVIKADQNDEQSVWQELDEYVITRELDEHLRTFFDAYLNAIDNPHDPDVAGKVGVWVSGFFGSGKSHFIKILSYLLENRTVTQQGETRQAIDFFQDKIQDAKLSAKLKRAVSSEIDVILFNIDSKADGTDSRDALLRVFLKVFNEKLGYSADHPHIAHLERQLDQQGKLQRFAAAFAQESGSTWQAERDVYSFHADAIATALSSVTGQNINDGDSWLERLERDFSLSVENFSKWVREYLDQQGSTHRIMFLADEVGQFIGQDTHLMLNLQTITENLGTHCEGRAWVVVTSQEDIDAVLGDIRSAKANDFSKIQGRFCTRLSLSSSNVDEVIQKRLLHKVENARTELADLYRTNADILKNQLSFSNVGMTFKAYADEADFINVYPFAPYQFQLVQKVFESVRKAGATGLHLARGERSMLNAFQSAAIQISDQSTGVLIPLHRFYPSIESFLEGAIKSTINHASDNLSLEPFDSDLLKTLFLIRYVAEIRGNIDNLVTLFIDRIDADRLALRNQIEAALQRLEKETLISRNGEDYFFLTNEERDISREIKEVELNSGEERRFLGELLYDDILKGLRKHRYSVNGKDFGITRLCDLHPYGNKTDGDLVLSILSPLADEFTDYTEAKCIMHSTSGEGQVIIKLDDHKTLGRELRAYLQTDKYVTRKNDGSAADTTRKILSERSEDNRSRRTRLTIMLEQLLKTATYYAVGQQLTLKTSTLNAALDEALNYLIKNTFRYLSYIDKPSPKPMDEVKAILAAPRDQELALEGGKTANKAANEVLSYILLKGTQNHRILLNDLIENRFGRIPYGWLDWEVLILIARLVMQGEINLVMDGAVLEINAIYNAIATPNRWRRITLVKRQTIDRENLQRARKLAKDVFQQQVPDGEAALAEFIHSNLRQWREHLQAWQPLANTGDYPGEKTITEALKLITKQQARHESYQTINQFIASKNDLLDLADDLAELKNFYTSQKLSWENLRKAKNRFQPNRQQLDKTPAAATALNRIEGILENPAPYGMIKDAEGLIQTIASINDQLIDKQRTFSLARIDSYIKKIIGELDEAQAAADLRNQCLYNIEQSRQQTLQQQSIAHIKQSQSNAKEEMEEAIDRIEKAGQEIIHDKKKVADKTAKSQTSLVKPVTPQVHRPTKKRHAIHAGQLVTGNYLETTQQMEDFLNALREEISQAIARGERIEIK